MRKKVVYTKKNIVFISLIYYCCERCLEHIIIVTALCKGFLCISRG
uniref:Uncharacterized protein n=1 Tax=Lepeophtheirus salmonis TaxID=72036 RepID=A0A0K2UZB1_LEPSM